VQPGADDESGGGLLIVQQLSDRCGWYPLHNSEHAKVTWAVITRAGQAPGRLPASALPVRRRLAPAPARAARAPRPVDPAILARVKSALERL
jgi:hypothetical protein